MKIAAARSATNRYNSWRTPDVWSISLSAFFADLGYQSVLAAFPLFLVIYLHRPVWEYGLAMALSYGGGAVFSLIGARIGDRIGHRRLALIGNCFIPLLSLSALIANPAWAIGLLTGGWWARNLRSPSRRVMLNRTVTAEEYRTTVFGFLHALDVGGAAAAAILVIVAIQNGVSFRLLFLFTIVPLLLSTVMLSRTGTDTSERRGQKIETSVEARQTAPIRQTVGARAIFVSTALYGFTFYSIGFPVLTIAQKTGSRSSGIAAFLVFQAFSAATGYLLARRLGATLVRRFINLGLLGYLVSAIGALVLVVDIHCHLGTTEYLVGIAILGFALGVIETLEPSLIAVLSKNQPAGRTFGVLSSSRSIGLFVGNLVMGLLYQLGPSWSYGYASIMAALAAVIIVVAAGSLGPKE